MGKFEREARSCGHFGSSFCERSCLGWGVCLSLNQCLCPLSPGTMAASIDKMLPTGAALDELVDWAKVLTATKLKPEQWKAVATELGEADLDDFPTIATIEVSEYAAAAKTAEFNPIARARLNLAVNIARTKFKAEVADLFPPAPPMPAAGAAASSSSGGTPIFISDVAAKESNGLRVKKYFDQGSALVVEPVEEEKLLVMRARWSNLMGAEPEDSNDYTDEQLSVLYRLTERGQNLLAFDMGVWGPYGGRRDRHFMMTTYHTNEDGQKVASEIRGACTLDDWLEGWQFAMTGFVMGASVERGVAETYMNFFSRMAKAYPGCWHLACQAEWQLRFEWAKKELRRQRRFHAENPGLSYYKPEMPWNSVLRSAVKSLESISFWETEFKEKARQFQIDGRSQSDSSWTNRQAAMAGTARVSNAVALAGTASGIPSAPGQGRKALKRKAAEARSAEQTARPRLNLVQAYNGGGSQSQATLPDGRPGWADDLRADGRWMYAQNGKGLCYAFGRNENGCQTVCDKQFEHLCELCRGQHRTIHCPTNPGWSPPAAEKGKGKGKGKKGKGKGKWAGH